MKNLIYFVKVILMLTVAIVNGAISAFVFYTEAHHDCECGPNWRRFVIKYVGIIIACLAIVAYFTPIIKIIKAIPLIGGLLLLTVFGLVILMLYCVQKYLKDIESNECQCTKKDKLKLANQLIGWASTTTLLITAAVIVAILFYLL
jgi:Mn2+/Fe2+ NRAMP family transporter